MGGGQAEWRAADMFLSRGSPRSITPQQHKLDIYMLENHAQMMFVNIQIIEQLPQDGQYPEPFRTLIAACNIFALDIFEVSLGQGGSLSVPSAPLSSLRALKPPRLSPHPLSSLSSAAA